MAPQLVSVIGCIHTDYIMMIDRLPAQGESLGARQCREGLGGKGANSAIAAYRTSHNRPPDGIVSPDQRIDDSDENEIEVCMIGAVGTDDDGHRAKDGLQRNGIDVSGVREEDNIRTGVSFVQVEIKTGENRCTFANYANDRLTVNDFVNVEGLANGRRPDLVIAQMELDRAVVEQIMRTTGEAGIDFLLNAAPATVILTQYYEYITHLIVNENEAAILSGYDIEEVQEDSWEEIAEYFLELGVKNVVLTLGAGGAYFAGSDDRGHVPACQITAVDCTGAGDTFTGAYATDYLRQKQGGREWDIKAAVERACNAAALVVTRIGAQDGIPWMDEIDHFEQNGNSHRLSRMHLEAPSESATDNSEEL